MLYNDTVLLLFAKAPMAGSVNTRLIPDIGVEKATQLQHDLIHQRLLMLADANLCAVNLLCAPDNENECFIQCKQQYPITLYKQIGNNLGERMLNAAKQALIKYSNCIVIGTDAPALDVACIKQAIDTLYAGSNVVFVPAEDGGYVLLGVKQAHAFLFEEIEWGSDKVMQQSRQQLKRHDVSFSEMPMCWDVDRLEDYQRYLAM